MRVRKFLLIDPQIANPQIFQIELEHFRYVFGFFCRFAGVLILQKILGHKFANSRITTNIGSSNCKFAICHTCGRSANVTILISPQSRGFSELGGRWFLKKTWSRKSCDTVPLKQTSAHTRMPWCHFTKLYKNTISWDYPFKKQKAEWMYFLKEIYKNLFFNIQLSIHKINYLSSLSKVFSPQ